MWVCVNGHDVRDGAFVCPRCGSDAVADPDRSFEPVPTSGRAALRVAARKELSNRLSTGVLLFVGGLFLIGLSIGAASDGDSGWVVSLLVVLAQVAFVVGACFVLVAVVGHGVRLGIETARSAPSD